MNITLENFLNHIFGDRSGKAPMVWIYQNDRNFYPGEQGFAESEPPSRKENNYGYLQ